MKRWFVIQTIKGQENKISNEVRNEIAEANEDVFILENEKEYKIKGEWIKDRKPFFPGYIFVDMEEDKAEDFNIRLRKRRHKLIDVDGVVTPVKPEEQDYLMRLGGEDHIIHHSEGFRIDDYVLITSGSFKGFNGEIKKLDRHHRQAKVCVPLLGKAIEVEIGLEIIENKTFKDLTQEEKLKRPAKIVD